MDTRFPKILDTYGHLNTKGRLPSEELFRSNTPYIREKGMSNKYSSATRSQSHNKITHRLQTWEDLIPISQLDLPSVLRLDHIQCSKDKAPSIAVEPVANKSVRCKNRYRDKNRYNKENRDKNRYNKDKKYNKESKREHECEREHECNREYKSKRYRLFTSSYPKMTWRQARAEENPDEIISGLTLCPETKHRKTKHKDMTVMFYPVREQSKLCRSISDSPVCSSILDSSGCSQDTDLELATIDVFRHIMPSRRKHFVRRKKI